MKVVLLFVCVFVSLSLSLPSRTTSCSASLDITSKDGHLWANGKRFNLKGVSWFGFETANNVFHGLWAQDYHFFLGFLKNNSFNALRIPFYLELMLNDAQPDSINFYQMNTDLKGLSSLQVLDKIVQAAADIGILVMFDLHSFLPGTFMQDNLWYDSAHPESTVLATWDKLVTRYANQWNVVALDLKNEPWGTTWNTGDLKTDWDQAATRIGNHIHSNGGQRFLIFVEGTNKSPACADNCFWGEDLMGVHQSQVNLTIKEKLVYSPHCYGPSVSAQPYFSDPKFPDNMPAIWDTHYGFVPNVTGNAIAVGEWGGQLGGQDSIWLDAFVKYLNGRDTADNFIWCLNPDSGDTGGLLDYDWKTPIQGRLDLCQKLVPNPTVVSTNEKGEVCVM